MKRSATSVLLLGLALLPTGCLPQQQQQQRLAAQQEAAKRPTMPPPLHLGAVHQVYPEQGFALLRIIGPMPGPGVTLITHPANGSTERIGNLSISSQQPSRDGIVAADIRSGTVVKGDRVFRYRNIATQEDNSGDVIAAERPAGLALPEVSDLSAIPLPTATSSEEDEAPIPPPTAAAVETTVLPTIAPSAPGSDPGAPSAPAQAPGYLDSIPDTIDGWDSM